MKHGLSLAAVAIVGLGALAGCSAQGTSSSEAIQYAKTLETPKQRTDYLVRRAQAFVKSEDYQEAIKALQYVLLSVDAHSQAATDLLEQAETKLDADAQAVIGDTKKPGGLSTGAL